MSDVLTEQLFEYRAEFDTNVFSGEPVVRVHYRRTGTKQWRRFLLVPDEGESFASVAANIEPAHVCAFVAATPVLVSIRRSPPVVEVVPDSRRSM